MLSRALGLLSADMAIDLGAANTLVYVKPQGIALDELSTVAFTIRGGNTQALAVGDDAERMLGRTPGNIDAVRPLRNTLVADFEVVHEIRHFIQDAQAAQLLAARGERSGFTGSERPGRRHTGADQKV